MGIPAALSDDDMVTFALLTETTVVVAAGVLADNALVSAIIGGIFLLLSAAINAVTLWRIHKEDRWDESHRAKPRPARPKSRADHRRPR